jgi:hypothetical protein
MTTSPTTSPLPRAGRILLLVLAVAGAVGGGWLGVVLAHGRVGAAVVLVLVLGGLGTLFLPGGALLAWSRVVEGPPPPSDDDRTSSADVLLLVDPIW